MPRQVKKPAKEHYYDKYNHRNNQCCYNPLILENSIKLQN